MKLELDTIDKTIKIVGSFCSIEEFNNIIKNLGLNTKEWKLEANYVGGWYAPIHVSPPVGMYYNEYSSIPTFSDNVTYLTINNG